MIIAAMKSLAILLISSFGLCAYAQEVPMLSGSLMSPIRKPLALNIRSKVIEAALNTAQGNRPIELSHPAVASFFPSGESASR